MIDPNQDGLTFINIYSKAKTPAGRWLSNFSYFPFTCEDGKFSSIEGYWYWLLTGNESLRNLYGWEAKETGRNSTTKTNLTSSSPEFIQKIKNALDIKLLACPYDIDLPITHYYMYEDKVVIPKEHKWVVQHIASFFHIKAL